eukprot:TRINITY_DN57989_c0_g1_i1.p1 TRINITY_DN57989_c0_g1~~TRINITY_DN57989_c0_g1_i1.p1  ORF type:complete len:304 (+),score=126.25 TRINITY_DN57989_c0_g1_i1:77-988(+)
MVSGRVRKQMVFVSACRRRLTRVLKESGDKVEEGGRRQSSFEDLVEQLRDSMETIKKLKAECDKVKKKADGKAAQKRHEFNGEVHHAKGLLKRMEEIMRPLQKDLDKREKKGKTDGKYTALRRDVNMKEELISAMRTEIEKLEWQPEYEMDSKDQANMDEANKMLRAARAARRSGLMQGALTSDDAPPAGGEPDEDDPEFDAKQREIAQNRKDQEVILGRILHSLGTLKQQAHTIGDSIDQSNKHLEDMEDDADNATTALKRLNRATLRAYEEVSNQSYFTNIACFLLLIALCGIAVYYLDLI